MSSSMSKANVIKAVAAATGETEAAAARFLAAFQDVVIGEVANGNSIRLTGFAAFTPADRAARTVRNPRTGENIEVPATKVVKIRPLGRFKDEVADAA